MFFSNSSFSWGWCTLSIYVACIFQDNCYNRYKLQILTLLFPNSYWNMSSSQAINQIPHTSVIPILALITIILLLLLMHVSFTSVHSEYYILQCNKLYYASYWRTEYESMTRRMSALLSRSVAQSWQLWCWLTDLTKWWLQLVVVNCLTETSWW